VSVSNQTFNALLGINNTGKARASVAKDAT